MEEQDVPESEQHHNGVCSTQEEHLFESQPEQMTQNEFMTQNELTQLGEFDEDSRHGLSPTPQSPVNPRSLPWGRLIPCSPHLSAVSTSGGGNHVGTDGGGGGGRMDLFPRDAQSKNNTSTKKHGGGGGVNFLGLSGLHPSDTFNEYVLGRSPKCDVVATKPPAPEKETEKEAAVSEWAHGMISNRHCRIFCMLKPTGEKNNLADMEVYVEDTSGNGTLVNGTTLLRRGEKRILHTGDEVCLVNPKLLQRKIRSTERMSDLQRHHSFLFVNVFAQQGRHIVARQVQQHHLLPSPAATAIVMRPPANQRKGLVDVRATNMPSIDKKNSLKRRVSPRRLPPRRIQDHYDIRDLLGSGTCGEVRRAIHRRTGQELAVKIIGTSKKSRSSLLLANSSAFEAEAAILQELDHPYIVKLMDVFVSPGTAVYLVMELLNGGDLFDRIIQKGKYTEVESRRVMRRLLSAVYYLHEERNVVHRDLKPENILCVNHSSDIEVKLTDFGLAKSVTEEGLKTFCGTPQYFAPEVLRRRHTVAGRGRYGKEADLWSLGVILYILLSGTPPFDMEQGLGVVTDAHIRFPHEVFEGVSPEAKNLVRQLLRADPKARITVAEACNHEWMLVEDGDTHTHPLHDPMLQHLGKSRARDASNDAGESAETSKAVTSAPFATEHQALGGAETQGPTKDVVKDEKVAETSEVPTVNKQAVDVPEIQIAKNTGEENDFRCTKGSGEDTTLKEQTHLNKNVEESAGKVGDASEMTRCALSPRDLNRQLENFRQVIAKSAGTKEVPTAKKSNRKARQSSVTPSPLNIIAAPRNKASNKSAVDLLAANDGGSDENNNLDGANSVEMADEICSQFSDEEIETVSSFGTASLTDKKSDIERIPSTSSSSIGEKETPRIVVKRPPENRTKPKKSKRRKTRDFCSAANSPSAAADEGNIWKHVSGDEQKKPVKPAAPSKNRKNVGGSKKGKGNSRGKKAKDDKHTQTTLSRFFRKKPGS